MAQGDLHRDPAPGAGVGERLEVARNVAGERIEAAREAAGERIEAAREAAAEAIARVKPSLRGTLHKYAFYASVLLGAGLVVWANTHGWEATIAIAIYVASLCALFGVSALYHRIDWRTIEARKRMRRLDHTMIFLLIAGTMTPFALLVLDGALSLTLLIAAWVGAAAGICVELIWTDSPKWLSASVYVGVGLLGVIGFPAILAEAGIIAGLLIAAGGALYGIGAAVYALERPNPRPAVFGYHEVFHALVIAAAAAHFAAVALFALPG